MKLPSFQFYPGDWRKDENLSRCSLQAKGALIEIMCIAFQCEKKGVLMSGGEPWTTDDISRAIGGDLSQNEIAIKELLEKKVLKKDKKGAIFSKRMVKDDQVRKVKRAAGLKGGNPKLLKQVVKQVDNHTAKQNPTPSVSGSVSSSTSANKIQIQAPVEKWNADEKGFLTDQKFKEEFCMTKYLDMQKLESIQKSFVLDLRLKGEPTNDLKRYFVNWYNKIISNGGFPKFPVPTEDLTAEEEYMKKLMASL